MRILLSYSTAHWDPTRAPADHEHWGSSSNVIARALFDGLSRHGEVVYVDAGRPEEVAGQSFDLFVGIARNFPRFLELCAIERSVFVAVNVHPLERNRRLSEFVRRHGLDGRSIGPTDLVANTAEIDRALRRAEAVLCFGTMDAFNSYVRHGVSPQRVRLLNYGLDPRPREHVPHDGPVRVGYAATELGLRKGFDVAADILERVDLVALDAVVDVVGPPSSPAHVELLERLRRRLGDRLTHREWLALDSEEYRELMASTDVMLFPSLEEGQAGTVMEGIAWGQLPLITREAGFDHAPLGFLEPAPGSERNVALFERACRLEPDERARLRRETLAYYEDFHAGFEAPLQEALDDVLAGTAWPRASVVLPIHDKERTIRELLRWLDRGLRRYGHADLHVIFDGCSDGTERVVRRFLDGRRGYEVRYSVTPDVFEVRTNNLGLREARGRYGVIVQDDNYVYDDMFLFEGVAFLEKARRTAILGGLGGVNFYPRGTTDLPGPGQISITPEEVYWRQDARTDPALADRFFEVDAVMRGPVFFRKSFLEEHGYLDEAYAPLYCDDMDICMRAHSVGQSVHGVLMDVENRSLTMGAYDEERTRWFEDIIRRNTDRFYERWQPSATKDHGWVHRTRPVSVGRWSGLASLRRRTRGIWSKARLRRMARRALRPLLSRRRA